VSVLLKIRRYFKMCSYFKFGVEESIASVLPDYNSDKLFKSNHTFCVFLICNLKNHPFLRRKIDQLFKFNLTFCVVCVINLQFEKSVFLRRVVHSQSTLQRQLRRQIKKKTPFIKILSCRNIIAFVICTLYHSVQYIKR
jgi:hypothetical protein